MDGAVAASGTRRVQFFFAGDDIADKARELLAAFAALIGAMGEDAHKSWVLKIKCAKKRFLGQNGKGRDELFSVKTHFVGYSVGCDGKEREKCFCEDKMMEKRDYLRIFAGLQSLNVEH